MQPVNKKNRTPVVAAAHASAPLFDLHGGLDKTVKMIAEAARDGANLIVFPESFLPGFPVWCGLYRPIDAHRFFRRFADSALMVDSDEMRLIQAAAAKHRIFVNLGFCEVSSGSPGCMWNSQALISDEGKLLNIHRKLVPTFYEQLCWNRGDAAGLRVVNTSIGRIGGLICGENNNPLARYVLMSEVEEIHCSCYPAIWPFHNPLAGKPYNLKDAIRFRAAAHSFEAKAYTVVAASVLTEETISIVSDGDQQISDIMRASPRAHSMIVGPGGDLIADCQPESEAIVLAEVNLSELVELRQHHDMAGYYNRHELFQLKLRRDRPKLLISGEEGSYDTSPYETSPYESSMPSVLAAE